MSWCIPSCVICFSSMSRMDKLLQLDMMSFINNVMLLKRCRRHEEKLPIKFAHNCCVNYYVCRRKRTLWIFCKTIGGNANLVTSSLQYVFPLDAPSLILFKFNTRVKSLNAFPSFCMTKKAVVVLAWFNSVSTIVPLKYLKIGCRYNIESSCFLSPQPSAIFVTSCVFLLTLLKAWILALTSFEYAV